jgi:hypothetical protein
MHDRVLTDTVISDGDEALYDANVKACAAHLADLVRVHGQPPEMIQPASYPVSKRTQARRGFPAVRPSRRYPACGSQSLGFDHPFRPRQQLLQHPDLSINRLASLAWRRVDQRDVQLADLGAEAVTEALIVVAGGHGFGCHVSCGLGGRPKLEQ